VDIDYFGSKIRESPRKPRKHVNADMVLHLAVVISFGYVNAFRQGSSHLSDIEK